MRDHSSTLNRPLPADVAVGSARWWLSYRNYPVFSAAWTGRRALLFGLFIVAWGALSGIAQYANGIGAGSALGVFAAFTIGVLVIVNAGPALAAVVRHRRLRPATERVLVVVAIVAGLFIALAADLWSSSTMAELIGGGPERRLDGAALGLNLVVLLAIYTLVGGGLALRAYLSEDRRLSEFRARREIERLRAEKLDADQQLAVLQAQVEPHFLFNTLATIRSSLREDPERAEGTLDALCDYLRATIPRLRGDEPGAASTVGDQLEICRHYLELMRLRMSERLAFHIEADDAVRRLAFPPFILLSLVENAIRHGVEPRTAGGRIELKASRQGERLLLEVADDGVGLHEATGGGVGLANIRRQLALRYGDRAALALDSRPGGGVSARIDLPVEPAS